MCYDSADCPPYKTVKYNNVLQFLTVWLFVVLSPGAFRGQANDTVAYPTHPLPPVIVPWELGGEKFKLHTKDLDSAPFPAHQLIGNVYYVGQADYALT